MTMYTTRTNDTPDAHQDYFDEITMAWMDKSRQEFLAEPFTEDEVSEAINTLDGSKAPGLDGFTGCFYKDILVPYLIDMFQEAIETGILPPTLRSSHNTHP